MRICVDPDKCEGHNRCFSLAPELFEVDEFGIASTKNNGEVPKGMEDKADLAIANCPEFAISILED
ncbi:MAG: ferredoxin [Alphaproteobacteria bacterium]